MSLIVNEEEDIDSCHSLLIVLFCEAIRIRRKRLQNESLSSFSHHPVLLSVVKHPSCTSFFHFLLLPPPLPLPLHVHHYLRLVVLHEHLVNDKHPYNPLNCLPNVS